MTLLSMRKNTRSGCDVILSVAVAKEKDDEIPFRIDPSEYHTNCVLVLVAWLILFPSISY